jgi:hypothetical protein
VAVLRLNLRASRALAVVLALVHGTGSICLLIVAPGVAGATLALLILALGAAAARDRALLRARGSVRALELAGDAVATLELADGRRVTAHVGRRRHVGPWWVSLPVEGTARRNLVVVRDMLPAEQFRALRLWALWGRVPDATGLRSAA